jgi:hypothetical protein
VAAANSNSVTVAAQRVHHPQFCRRAERWINKTYLD